MKKLLIGFLALSLVLLSFVSCNSNAITDADAVGTVSFAEMTASATKGLNATVLRGAASDYFWRYTAVKQDDGGTLGQTGNTHDVSTSLTVDGDETTPVAGLTSTKTFSVGEWSFVLYGYSTKDLSKEKGTDTYTFSNDSAAVKATVVASKTITVKVGVTAETTGNGNISFTGITITSLEGGGFGSDAKMQFKIVGDSHFGNWTAMTYDPTDYWHYNCGTDGGQGANPIPCGEKTVEVGIFNHDDLINPIIKQSITVSVFRALTTQISGTVEDLSGGVTFDVNMPQFAVASTTKKASEDDVYPETTITAAKCTPAGDDSNTVALVPASTTFVPAVTIKNTESAVFTDIA